MSSKRYPEEFKTEVVRQITDRGYSVADVFDYIEVFYNQVLGHSHLGGVSPEAFEMASV